jgi:hypothetical protein
MPDRTLGIAAAILAAAGGCTLLTPLDDLQGTSGGAGGSAGANGAGGDTGGVAGGGNGPPAGCEPPTGSAGEPNWAQRFGDSQVQQVRGVATDSTCGVIVGGLLEGTIDFGDGNVLQSAGNADVFVVRLDSRGSFVWGKSFGDADDQSIADLVVDSFDRIVLAGSFAGTIDFGDGPMTSAGAYDVFAVALQAADGAPIWSWSMGGPDTEVGRGVAVDARGVAFVFGDYFGNFDSCTGPVVHHGGSNVEDIFVSKLNLSGACILTGTFGDNESERAGDIAIDSNGDILIAGDFRGSFNFGGANLVAGSGVRDVFVARLDEDTNHIWSHRFGGGTTASRHEAGAIAVDASGSVFVAGGFSEGLDFGGTVDLTTTGTYDNWVAKLDGTTGLGTWAGTLGSSAFTKPALVPDARGGVFYASAFVGKAIFGGGEFTAIAMDSFAAHLSNADGEVEWLRVLTGDSDQLANALASDAEGAILLGGSCVQAVNFGDGIERCNAGEDGLLIKLAP